MTKKFICRIFSLPQLALLFSGILVLKTGAAMTLAEAEQLALRNDPLLAKTKALTESFEEKAVAAYSWPDPKVKLGLVNFPVEEFNFEKEPMTQAVIGMVQMFPPAGSVGAKRNQLEAKGTEMSFAQQDRKLQTIRNVRQSWFGVYQWAHSKLLVQESVEVFAQLKKITRLQYQAGRGKQQDVIQAQLEESLLLDQIDEMDEKLRLAIAALKLSLNVETLESDLDSSFPELPEFPGGDELISGLKTHPWLKVGQQRVKAAENGVEFADAQFNPSWSLDLSYGFRGADRGDFVSAMLLMDLPLFTGNRQSRLYKSSQSDLAAARFDLEDLQRQLRRRLDDSLANYQRSDDRVQLFEKQLLPQAEQNTEASLNAYQSGVNDFGSLVRARLTELKSRLQYLSLLTKRAKAHAELLYLAGGR